MASLALTPVLRFVGHAQDDKQPRRKGARTHEGHSQRAKAILHKLPEGLSKPGDHRMLDNGGERIMPVSEEHMGSCDIGPMFRLAHHTEQNGDLCAGPEMLSARVSG